MYFYVLIGNYLSKFRGEMSVNRDIPKGNENNSSDLYQLKETLGTKEILLKGKFQNRTHTPII